MIHYIQVDEVKLYTRAKGRTAMNVYFLNLKYCEAAIAIHHYNKVDSR